MAWTYTVIWFEQQEAIGAIRLVPVVFDNRRLAKQVPDDERNERRASEMNHIRRSDFADEVHQAWVANNAIWQLRIIHISRGSLREQRDFDRFFVMSS
jgi:hypothetical protein